MKRLVHTEPFGVFFIAVDDDTVLAVGEDAEVEGLLEGVLVGEEGAVRFLGNGEGEVEAVGVSTVVDLDEGVGWGGVWVGVGGGGGAGAVDAAEGADGVMVEGSFGDFHGEAIGGLGKWACHLGGRWQGEGK